MKLFFRLTKIDEAKREVWGRATQEVVDKAREIFDYATSVPYFKAWSDGFKEDTDGKSLGNLRAMHGKVCAGKIIAIDYNDAEKAIDIGTKIVNDSEWKMVEEACYTGFSIAGEYVKRWDDATLPNVKRFTANPSEISLVDSPCVPTAKFFDVIKADGVIEQRAFLDKYDGQEIWDAARAMDAICNIQGLLQNEEWESKQDPDQIASLKVAVAALKDYLISELQEGASGKEASTMNPKLLKASPESHAALLEVHKASPESHAALLEVHKAFGAFGAAQKIAVSHMSEVGALHKAMTSKLRAFGKAYGAAEGDLPIEEGEEKEETGEKGCGEPEKVAEVAAGLAKLRDDNMVTLLAKLEKAETTVDQLLARIVKLEKMPVQSPIDKAIEALAKTKDSPELAKNKPKPTLDEEVLELTKAAFQRPLEFKKTRG